MQSSRVAGGMNGHILFSLRCKFVDGKQVGSGYKPPGERQEKCTGEVTLTQQQVVKDMGPVKKNRNIYTNKHMSYVLPYVHV